MVADFYGAVIACDHEPAPKRRPHQNRCNFCDHHEHRSIETNIVQEYKEVVQDISSSDVLPVHPPDAPWKLEKLTASMGAGGWQGRPLLVMLVRTDGVPRYQGMTGSHRSEAARKSGLPTIPCIVIDRDTWHTLLGGVPYPEGFEIGAGPHRAMFDALSLAEANATAPQDKKTFRAGLSLIQTEMDGQDEQIRKTQAIPEHGGIEEE